MSNPEWDNYNPYINQVEGRMKDLEAKVWDLTRERDALQAAVDKCRADAERYRFLVEELNYVGAFSLGKDNYLQVCGPGIGKVRKTIDVAIDAARQAAERAKGVE